MTNTLTPWYPPHINPVRVGVYETNTRIGRYQHWNGKFWGLFDPDAELAADSHDCRSFYQSPSWRGLAYPPQSHNNPASCEKK